MTSKRNFRGNFKLASQKFNAAIDEIDKAIARLNKVKEELLSSENQLRLANDKAEDLSIKKLAKNAPSLLQGVCGAGKRFAGQTEKKRRKCTARNVRLRCRRRPGRIP